ncbi:hypothetical protein BN7874_274 [Phage NCTB]|nr:hypothetical protein BN7874_274 [Phage NCTB]
MINDHRQKLLKAMGAPTQFRLGANRFPKDVDSEELLVLWKSFILSNQFKDLTVKIPKSTDNVGYNFLVCCAWLNFLDNFQIPVNLDVDTYIEKDISLIAKARMKATLSNLRLCKVLPEFTAKTVSYRLVLPSVSDSSKRLNSVANAQLRVLTLYSPTKKNVIDLSVDKGPKLKKASVDRLLDTKLQGYLFGKKDTFLKYSKPLDSNALLALPEYQWYYKPDSQLRFRHNGDTLAVLDIFNYTGVIPLVSSKDYLRNFDRIMSKALRVL